MPELKGSVLFPAADNLLLNGPITRQPGLCLAAQRRGRLQGDNAVSATSVSSDLGLSSGQAGGWGPGL